MTAKAAAPHTADGNDRELIAQSLYLLSASFAAATTRHQVAMLHSTELSDTSIIQAILAIEAAGNAACRRAQAQADRYRA